MLLFTSASLQKEIPSKIQLLPGQVLKLQEALTQERRRYQPLPPPPLPPRPASLPSASICALPRKPTEWNESPNNVPVWVCFSYQLNQNASTSSSNTSVFNPCCTRRIPKVGFAFSLCCRCFFRVTRQEAEEMLEANPERGSLIIRPSSVANSYALSLRQATARSPPQTNMPFYIYTLYIIYAVR